jgi:hypothetical protein
MLRLGWFTSQTLDAVRRLPNISLLLSGLGNQASGLGPPSEFYGLTDLKARFGAGVTKFQVNFSA